MVGASHNWAHEHHFAAAGHRSIWCLSTSEKDFGRAPRRRGRHERGARPIAQSAANTKNSFYSSRGRPLASVRTRRRLTLTRECCGRDKVADLGAPPAVSSRLQLFKLLLFVAPENLIIFSPGATREERNLRPSWANCTRLIWPLLIPTRGAVVALARGSIFSNLQPSTASSGPLAD